jgi:hypothetical protein
MKTLKLNFLALIAVAGIIAACSLDSSEPVCFYQAHAPTTIVSGPDSTTVNVPITINVAFTVSNSCGEFNRFAEGTTFPKAIAPIIDYNGCDCTPGNTLNLEPYIFRAPTAGRYVLNFATGTTSAPISKTITVTQ